MSLPNDVVVDFNESISLPPGVAAAYRRSLSVLPDIPAFIDRVFHLNELVNSIYAWRYANCITGDQLVWMLRSIRATFQRDPGIICDIDSTRSAIEVDEHDAISRSISLVD
ncbi:hypothetical protein [Xylella fastidiosa]|uniref:hypothetical protein n=1 Tax=Xylella fastidiosa TaxID=2371 RepID=UPI0011212514|nr:hypothetical protein [Xylella fastidiosa]TNW23384.1 hypothetical protein EIP73_11375 [Xylella fastidiosa subsp. pauca]